MCATGNFMSGHLEVIVLLETTVALGRNGRCGKKRRAVAGCGVSCRLKSLPCGLELEDWKDWISEGLEYSKYGRTKCL